MKNLSFPSAQTILLIIAAIVTVMTWVIPAGKYDTLKYIKADNTFLVQLKKETKTLPATQATLEVLNIKIPLEKFTSGDIYKPVSIPNTYSQVEANAQNFFDFIQSPIKGIIAASDIIFLVLIIGGLIGIMNKSGAFNAGIFWLSKSLMGREYLLIILTTTLVALGGTTFGFAEETLAFYPILIPVFIAAGYDAMVGVACIFLGSSIGTMCSTTNPFSTIIASDAAGINWTTGLTGRIIMLVLCVFITIVYIMRYARKVKKDPTKSIIFEQQEEMKVRFGGVIDGENLKLTLRLKLIIFVFSVCFIIMIIGVSRLDWWFLEMTTIFLAGAILIAFIARIKENDFIQSFTSGASDLLGVTFIIGIARGVSILMDNGLISDTVLFHASNLTQGMEKGVFVNVLFFIYQGLSIFIPSSSGMAVLTMPIMSPLADTVNIGREFVVDVYLYGSGVFHVINPTGLILASLGIVNIGFNKFIRFVFPLFIILTVVTMIFLTISVY